MPLAVDPGDPRKQLFPEDSPDPAPQTFELGLVLGGTVSVGAYTAGALDFLLEALEAWYAKPPPHKVVISTAGGSSGGAVCAAILGLLSSRKVDHFQDPATGDQPGAPPKNNPLWKLWVEDFDIGKLLSTSDLDWLKDVDKDTGADIKPVQHVAALVNCKMIDDGAAALARIGGTACEVLPYFAAPFRVAVTVTNMRGVPYKVTAVPHLADFSGAAYVQHDDFGWFAFPNGSKPDAALPAGKRPDEFWLDAKYNGQPQGDLVGYETLALWATASGAMPLGLAARTLRRPREHYRYRPAVRLARLRQPGAYPGYFPEPDWGDTPDDPPGSCTFTAVDGGTLNNDPFTLVRRAMVGLVGRSATNPTEANRAILMIDPLADQPKALAKTGRSLLAVAEGIVDTFKDGARYLTADLDLFGDEAVYSRFQLVPFHTDRKKVGSEALAGSLLYAASGWCAPAFRAHDYRLGRSNMQSYLRSEFVLAGDNPLFDNWTLAQRQTYAVDGKGRKCSFTADSVPDRNTYFLPVIPYKTVDGTPPAWPVGAYNPNDLKEPLRERLKAVAGRLALDNVDDGHGVKRWFVAMLAVPGVVDLLVSKTIDGFKADLKAAGLWTGW